MEIAGRYQLFLLSGPGGFFFNPVNPVNPVKSIVFFFNPVNPVNPVNPCMFETC
jgi:hypothetical protein